METHNSWGPKSNPKAATLALSNHLILENIFKYLSIEDYKPCRAVCRLWKDLTEAEFKQKMRLCMNFYPKWMDVPDAFAKYPAPNDLCEFFRSCKTEHPFEAFQLCGIVPWPASKLREFFATEGKSLTDVMFQNVALKSNRMKVERVNTLFKKYPLMNMINGLVNLKSIYITCNACYSSFSLSLKDLVHFEDIHIQNCTIEITESILTPRNLTLEDNTFTRNNRIVEFVVINNFVNFSAMKSLRLKSNTCRMLERNTTTAINLTSNVKLETVNFLNPEMDNWYRALERPESVFNLGDSEWEIDTLSMYGVPFNLENKMKIKRFHIYNDVLCPNYLPSSLERLSISKLERRFAEPDEEIYMPNVYCLGLHHEFTIRVVFPFLIRSFPNLTELILGSQVDSDGCRIDLKSIPESVDKIMIIEPRFQFVGIKCVDTLVVRNASIEFCKRISKIIVPKSHFILFVDQLKEGDGLSLIRDLTKQSFRKLVVGMFDSKSIDGLKEHENFPNFDFPPNTNSTAEFFALINENDNVIKSRSYKEMQKLLSNDQK